LSLEDEVEIGRNLAQSILVQAEGQVLPTTHPTFQRVDRVLKRLVAGLNNAPVDKDVAKALSFNLHVIDSPTVVNALVLPDGTTFVYTGLLEKECSGSDGDDRLAVVVGHEMAHALQRHGGERLSYFGVLSLLLSGATFVGTFLGLDPGVAVWRTACVLGLEERAFDVVLTLPRSRSLENEADHVGLFITAAACFDPRVGPKLWEKWACRMAAAPPMGKLIEDGMCDPEPTNVTAVPLQIPEYLSTHPAGKRHAKNLTAFLQEAERIAELSGCSEQRLALQEATQDIAITK